MRTIPKQPCYRKPFLKWVGGKYRYLESVLAMLPETGRYFEPFVGSAAVFLNVRQRVCHLADANGDLIALYRQIQDEGKPFVEYCRSFFSAENNTANRYYQFRALFNKAADKRLKSALFLYLNRHGFSGLCRYSRKEGYNTAYGSLTRPLFPEAALTAFIERLEEGFSVFSHCGFEVTMRQAGRNDVVYCDPPYFPLSATSRFVDYIPGGFGLRQQQALASAARAAAARGATVVISNNDVPVARILYAGAEIFPVAATRILPLTGERVCATEILAVFRPDSAPSLTGCPYQEPEALVLASSSHIAA